MCIYTCIYISIYISTYLSIYLWREKETKKVSSYLLLHNKQYQNFNGIRQHPFSCAHDFGSLELEQGTVGMPHSCSLMIRASDGEKQMNKLAMSRKNCTRVKQARKTLFKTIGIRERN